MKRILISVMILPVLLAASSCNISRTEDVQTIPVLDDSLKTEMLSNIKRYSQDSTDLPSDYFTDFGFRDWYRWPLIYPYSLNSVDTRDDGFIYIERGFKVVSGNQNDMERVQMGNIKEFAFNQNALVARTREWGNKKDEFEMFIYETEEVRKFRSLASMLSAAEEFGFKQSDTLISLEQYTMFFR